MPGADRRDRRHAARARSRRRRGPLGGIQTALHRAGDAACTLIVACDLPFLSRPFLAFLLARALEARTPPTSSCRAAAIAFTRCARHTIVACARRSIGASRRERWRCRRCSTRCASTIVEPEVVATFDPEGVMFWNVNTPDEYERACARAAMA